MNRLRALALAGAAALAACSPAEPDRTGLSAEARAALVERYYGCARQQDSGCVLATLHPEFHATGETADAGSRGGHAEAMARRLGHARVEVRFLPHEGTDLWVVELWNDRHGVTTSLLRSFTFENGLIRSKTVLAT
jgi:hypothetical protein